MLTLVQSKTFIYVQYIKPHNVYSIFNIIQEYIIIQQYQQKYSFSTQSTVKITICTAVYSSQTYKNFKQTQMNETEITQCYAIDSPGANVKTAFLELNLFFVTLH